MKGKLLFLFCGIVLLVAGMVWWYSYSSKRLSSPETKEPEATDAGQAVEKFLFHQKGKVVVLLLGMEGCPNTSIATKILAEMSQDCPDDVVLARLDVPPPNESAKPVKNWPYKYFYAVDHDRTVAKRLEFFYYPTLYILDYDGEMRYAGGCEAEKLKNMLAEIRAEPPGSEKKFYTRSLPAVGTVAAGFTAKHFSGESVDLRKFQDKGATLLLFTSVDCPFSREAVRNLPTLEKEFQDKDVVVVAIEKGTNNTKIKTLYKEIELGGPVLSDANGTISQKYCVEVTPFYFVINKDGKIAGRGPYTKASARQALHTALGLRSQGTSGSQSTGAG